MANKGYRSYRGRRGRPQNLLITVLVLILLAACAFLFLQRYITYTDNGKLRLDIPFLQKEEQTQPQETEPPQEPQQDVNLVIDDTPPKPAPEEPEQEELVGPRRLIELDVLPADADALKETVDAAGANGFAFRVKNDAGQVLYTSAAAMDDAVTETAADSQLLMELCAREDTYAVARLNCFHDSYYAWAHMEDAGICQSGGYIWYGSNSLHWLDPDKEAARQYIIDLAIECAQLGFDEILLDEMCYPSSGKLQKIDYSHNKLGKTEALVQFLAELRQALEPYGVKVSLLLDSRLLTVEGAELARESGQDLGVLLPLADAVYAPTQEPVLGAAFLSAQVGDESFGLTLVPMGETPGETENWYMVQ